MGGWLGSGGRGWGPPGTAHHHHPRHGHNRNQGIHRRHPWRLQQHSRRDRRLFSPWHHRKPGRGVCRKLDEGRHLLCGPGPHTFAQAQRPVWSRPGTAGLSFILAPRTAIPANLLLVALCVSAAYLLPTYPLFVLSLAIVNIIAVLGVNLVMGYAGQISLGHAG